MLATVKAADLAAALKHAVAARGTTMPILQHALVTAGPDVLHLETSDVEIFVRHTIPARVAAPGARCLRAEKLRAIALADGDIELRDDGRVTRGRSHYAVDHLPANDFPAPEESDFTPLDLDPVALREALALVAYAYNDDDVRPFVRAVHIEPGRVWSTNGYQAGIAALDGYDGPVIRLPGAQVQRLMDALQDGATVSVAGTPKVRMLRAAKAGAYAITVRCLDVDAPDIRALVPKLRDDPLVLSRDDLVHAMRRLAPFIADRAGKSDPVMVMERRADGVALTDRHGDGTELLDLLAPCKAAEGERSGLNTRYLLAALAVIDTDEIEFYWAKERGPHVLLPRGADPDQIVHLFMPYAV